MALRKGISVNLGLPAAPVTNNAELFQELLRVYNAINNLASAVDIYTGALSEPSDVFNQVGIARCYDGLNTKIYLECAAAIAFGETVGINGSGQAVLAVDGGARARGWCSNAAGGGIGDYIEVQLRGIFPAYPAATLTPGTVYYQSATPGVIGVGGAQAVGFAISDTILYFNPQL